MTIWTVIQDERLRELWGSGMTCAAIGNEIGFSGQGVSQRAQALGLPIRRHRRSPMWKPGDLNYLAVEAEKRNVSIYVLRARIIQVVLRDRMIGAVLDDQDKVEQLATASGANLERADHQSA